MKVLIVTSASDTKHATQASILYLASWCKKCGNDFEILDMSGTINYFDPPDEFFGLKNWLNPDIFNTDLSLDDHPEVDIIYYSSLFSTDIIIHGRHAVKVRKLFPDCITVLGGSAIRCLNDKQLEILRIIFDCVTTDYITDVKPDYSLVPIKPFVTIHSGQSCIYGKCRFCNTSALSNHYSVKNVDTIINELQEIEKYDVKDVMLSSDMFTRKYMNELIDKLIERNTNVPYNVMLRAEKWIDVGFADRLKKSGCTDVFIGAEAFDDGILKTINKGTYVENNINAIKSLHSAGIKVGVGMILFIPSITKEQLDIQLDNIEPLVSYTHEIDLEILSVINKSEFAQHPNKYGIELYPKDDKSIIPSWCHGFSPDIPWTFTNKKEIDLWIDHYDKLRLMLGDVVPSNYYKSIDYLKGEFRGDKT